MKKLSKVKKNVVVIESRIIDNWVIKNFTSVLVSIFYVGVELELFEVCFCFGKIYINLISVIRDGVCPLFGSHNIAFYPEKFADREIR